MQEKDLIKMVFSIGYFCLTRGECAGKHGKTSIAIRDRKIVERKESVVVCTLQTVWSFSRNSQNFETSRARRMLAEVGKELFPPNCPGVLGTWH